MSNPYSVTIDEASLARVREALDGLISRAREVGYETAGQVGNELLHEAIRGDDGYPTVPKAPPPLGGNLRSSGSAEVFFDGQEPVLQVAYNTPYAAAIHEGLAHGRPVRHWSEPGSGAKFLENRIIGNRGFWVNLWVSKIIRRLGL